MHYYQTLISRESLSNSLFFELASQKYLLTHSQSELHLYQLLQTADRLSLRLERETSVFGCVSQIEGIKMAKE